MAVPSICSGTPGTEAFVPPNTPSSSYSRQVCECEKCCRNSPGKNSTGPWSCDWLIFGLYFALCMPLQFFILLVIGSSFLITSLESFMDFFFPSSTRTICNLMVQRNGGQVILRGHKVYLKSRVHSTESNDFLNIFKAVLFFISLKLQL